MLSKLKQKLFWVNVFKIAFPFFVIVTLFSLLFNSASDIFSGNIDIVYERHFSDKKWIRFWLTKVTVSLIYGIYVTNKRMK